MICFPDLEIREQKTILPEDSVRERGGSMSPRTLFEHELGQLRDDLKKMCFQVEAVYDRLFSAMAVKDGETIFNIFDAFVASLFVFRPKGKKPLREFLEKNTKCLQSNRPLSIY